MLNSKRCRALIICGGLAVGGCAATVDVTSTKIPPGYFNVAAQEFGSLYIWDRSSNQCNFIDSLPFRPSDFTPRLDSLPQSANALTRQLQATASAELAANTDLTPQQELQAKAQLLSEYQYKLQNYNRVTIRNTKTRMEEYLENPENDISIWRLDEAVSSGSNLRYVVIYRGITAEKASVNRKNEASLEGDIDLGSVKSGLKGRLTNTGAVDFEGKIPPAIINAYVYQARIRGGLYNFNLTSGDLDTFMVNVLGEGKCE